MNFIIKLSTGIFFFIWLILSIMITLPITIILYAYDLGHPIDNEMRTERFLTRICFLNRK